MTVIARMRTALLAGAATLIWSSAAGATRRFPSEIEGALGLSYSPPCSVCHLRGNIGPGTARTPFAISLKARGMKPGDSASMFASILSLQKDRVDSDGDGTPDTQELQAGTDPNSAANASLIRVNGANYGCGGHQGSENGNERRAWAPFLGLGAWLLRRRGRARKVRNSPPS